MRLSEIKMSSARLASQAQAVQPTVGIEFELLVPREDDVLINDYDYNRRVTSLDEIIEFFNELNVNTRSQLRNLYNQLDRELNEWAEERADAEDYEDEELRLKFIRTAVRDYQEEFLEERDLDYTVDVYNTYDHIVDWPYQKSSEDTSLEEMQKAASRFTKITNIPAIAFNGHGGPREHGKFTFEKDSTVQHHDGNEEWLGAEIVTNRLDLDAAIYAIEKVRFYAYKVGAETNRTCGLHINVSVPNYDKLNYLKLIALIGDEHVLGVFNRLKNSYAPSAADRIRTSGKLASPDQMIQIADSLRAGDIDAVKNSLRILGRLSVNFHPDRIELRSSGGDWLNLPIETIVDTLHRLTVALAAAVDPEAHKQEYLTKLYKLIYNVRIPRKGELKSVYDLTPMEQYRIGFINRSDLRALMTRKQTPANLPK